MWHLCQRLTSTALAAKPATWLSSKSAPRADTLYPVVAVRPPVALLVDCLIR